MSRLPETVKDIYSFTVSSSGKTTERLKSVRSNWRRADINDVISDVLSLAMLGEGSLKEKNEQAGLKRYDFDAGDGPAFRQLADRLNAFRDPQGALDESIYQTCLYRANLIEAGLVDHHCAFEIVAPNDPVTMRHKRFSFFRRIPPLFPKRESKSVVDCDAALSQCDKQSQKEWADSLDATEEEEKPLSHILLRLPPRQRQVIELLLSGLTQRLIASELGISESAVSQHVTVAEERLKLELIS